MLHLSAAFEFVSLVWTHRTENKVADALAKASLVR